jgi:hypothetical protein
MGASFRACNELYDDFATLKLIAPYPLRTRFVGIISRGSRYIFFDVMNVMKGGRNVGQMTYRTGAEMFSLGRLAREYCGLFLNKA